MAEAQAPARTKDGERTGASPLEHRAVWHFQREVAAMPASLVVQIALWPDKLADWADAHGLSSSTVYNCLGGFKPYHRVRRLLARRLGVDKADLDHLIDTPQATSASRQPPREPPPGPGPSVHGDEGGERAEEAEGADRTSAPPTEAVRQPPSGDGDEPGQMALSLA